MTLPFSEVIRIVALKWQPNSQTSSNAKGQFEDSMAWKMLCLNDDMLKKYCLTQDFVNLIEATSIGWQVISVRTSSPVGSFSLVRPFIQEDQFI